MKEAVSLLLSLAVILGLAGCGNGATASLQTAPPPADSQSPSRQTPPAETSGGGGTSSSKVLAVYFSVPETDAPDGMTQEEENSTVVIDGEVLGNTQYMANVIQEATGGTLFRIEPETPYTTDHKALVALAKQEQMDKARPPLKANIEDLDQYDTVFIGYPIWWADLPMVVYTFLEEHDLSGKTIIPFNTHGGSGVSGTVRAIAGAQPNAVVRTDGLSISRDRIKNAKQDILDWVGGLDILKGKK